MEIVFFGTSDYCLPVLEALYQNFELVLVVTRPDKPVGRKQVLTASATKVWAQKNDIPAVTNLSGLNNLGNLTDLDLGLVADFGQIIPEEIFARPRLGTFNIHFSKLPDLRGPSPVQSALLRGDTTAWITVFKIDSGMDTGPILWQKSYPIEPDETAGELYTRLFQEAASEIASLIPQIPQIPLIPQAGTPTFCKMLTRQDGFVDYELLSTPANPQQIYNQYRAMTPWPGLWTIVPSVSEGPHRNKRMKILKCHLENGKLVLDEIQFEGKKPQKASGILKL